MKPLEIKANKQVFLEYIRLKARFGKGESACMAYCRFNNDVIGSSNLRDILNYCREFGIEYLTTLDFLAEAYQRKILTEAECDHFIYLADTKGKIPFRSITAYIASLGL
ncbi:MAG: hypothetical protein Q8R96_22595 [Bacteroidota bacterium]|nr:hypothetical protein [Bacteroidota bacterium]